MTYPETRRQRLSYWWWKVRFNWRVFWGDDGFRRWLAFQVAHLLPRRVVYHALIRAWVFASSGRHAHESPISLMMRDVIRRWDEEDH